MWYWRDQNFRGLRDIASWLSTKPDLNGFRDYCLLREQGLRRQSLSVQSEFLTKAQTWPIQQRRDFVRWVVEVDQHNPEIRHLNPHSLQENLIAPTIKDWRSETPSDPIPFRLGFDKGGLRIAIALDPTHQETILRMVKMLWGGVEMACHELPLGVLGSTSDVLADLDEIERLTTVIDDSTEQQTHVSKARHFREVVQNYAKYLDNARSTQSFQKWAESNGLKCDV